MIITKFKSLILFISFAFTTSNIFSQANPSISILPLNAGGVVAVGDVMDVKVTVLNTLTGNIVASKLRPIITIPALATILPTAQQTGLPPGWEIIANDPVTGQIRVCNASDVMGGNSQRDIIIKVQGTTIGGPTQCAVNLFFGGATCAVSGPQPSGNIGVDDFATSSITVIAAPLPLNLLSFNASLLNCKAALNWITESEINSDRFEIERNEISNANGGWTKVGEVTAKGTLAKSTYKYFDETLDARSVKLFYRLKIIDKDGSFKYSEILSLFFNCKSTQVSIFPNPVRNGKVNVTLSGATGITQSVLTSAAGQQVLKATLINGMNSINVSSIADGVYYLHIKEANGADKKVKLLIQK